MSLLQTHKTHCPYCGEPIELVIDCSVSEQSYVEDCFVCCRPMIVNVYCDEEVVSVSVNAENE